MRGHLLLASSCISRLTPLQNLCVYSCPTETNKEKYLFPDECARIGSGTVSHSTDCGEVVPGAHAEKRSSSKLICARAIVKFTLRLWYRLDVGTDFSSFQTSSQRTTERDSLSSINPVSTFLRGHLHRASSCISRFKPLQNLCVY